MTAITGGLLRMLVAQSHAKKAMRAIQNKFMIRDLRIIGVVHNPKLRRMRRPSMEPMNAMATHIQPCRLPVEMPLTIAPMLQPNASRDL